MAETNNLVLEHLRHLRGQIDRIETKLDDAILRLGHIEHAVAQHSVQFAEMNSRFDRIETRITRIDTRLDLVES